MRSKSTVSKTSHLEKRDSSVQKSLFADKPIVRESPSFGDFKNKDTGSLNLKPVEMTGDKKSTEPKTSLFSIGGESKPSSLFGGPPAADSKPADLGFLSAKPSGAGLFD